MLLPRIGIRIQESVRRGVIHESRAGQYRVDRRTKHEEIQMNIFERFFEHQSAFDFGRQNFSSDFPAFQLDDPVPGDTSRMNNTVNGAKARDRLLYDLPHALEIGNLRLQHENFTARLFDVLQFPDLCAHRIIAGVGGQPLRPFCPFWK